MEDPSSEEEESEPDEIGLITHINKKIPDNNDNYGVEVKINGEKQKLIIDTGSPVTVMPYDQRIHGAKEIKPLKERYQDVNENEIKFMGKTWVTVKYNEISTKLLMLITKRNDITPLLGVSGLKQQNRPTRKHIQEVSQTLHQQPHNKERRSQNTNNTGMLFKTTKARPMSYHLQEDV